MTKNYFLKKSLLLILLFLSIGIFSQLNYEKGYLINNRNEKSEILIRNEDWALNPKDFDYKISSGDKVLTGRIADVKEFGIYNFSKYVRYTGLIDQSSDNVQIIDNDKNLKLVEKTVFLKQLVEGKRNLYSYNDDKIKKFFYSDASTPITELIYKRYYADEYRSSLATNNEFRNQLAKSFSGEETGQKLKTITYKTQDLTKFFKKYNDADSDTAVQPMESKSQLNFHVKPGIGFTSVKLEFPELPAANVNFATKISPRFGLELEYILPFIRNKWALFTEPTYINYKQKGENTLGNPAEISYNSVDLPFGVRHYMFLNKTSRIFIEGSLNLADLSVGDNYVRYFIPGTTVERQFGFRSSVNLGGGIGYSYNNKIQISARYNSKNMGQYFDIKYSSFSLMASYNIVK